MVKTQNKVGVAKEISWENDIVLAEEVNWDKINRQIVRSISRHIDGQIDRYEWIVYLSL